MHSSSLDTEGSSALVKKDGDEALVTIATLVTEGRIPGKSGSKTKKFYEGPHCTPHKPQPDNEHHCDLTDPLCKKYNTNKDVIRKFWRKKQPLCIEVVLHCACKERKDFDSDILLEQWYFTTNYNRSSGPLFFNVQQLTSAIRSQLYFSQIAAWLTSQDDNTPCKIDRRNLSYRLVQRPANRPDATKFSLPAVRHDFPPTDVANGCALNVTFLSLPRMSSMPNFACEQCFLIDRILDDRMHVNCTLKGKHRCEDLEEFENVAVDQTNFKRLCSASTSTGMKMDLKDKGQMLLDAIERSAEERSESDSELCDMNESDIFSIKKTNNKFMHCDSPIPKLRQNKKILPLVHKAKQKITFDDEDDDKKIDIPTALEQAKFRKNLDNAASMVFHSRTGLPLTSSPAPVRRGKNCFDFDSSINSVYAIRSALFSGSFSTDEESESEGSIVSPCSPEIFAGDKKSQVAPPVKYRRKGHAANLLGSFEESVLNGRLEPVSTVHGFRAELGASGSFVPKHLVVPVTVFFFTLGDNDKVSSPYLSHINLGKKGYNVPKCGTVQVTLFNPLGTVVKMFVIMYDLSDMPPNSQTFIRQRTLYMPTHCKDENLEWGPKWLRYLIHLRFMSSKSGKIYLHSDIRMIIFRKSDMDTATAHGIDMSYELRSFTHMPANPRFSPRK